MSSKKHNNKLRRRKKKTEPSVVDAEEFNKRIMHKVLTDAEAMLHKSGYDDAVVATKIDHLKRLWHAKLQAKYAAARLLNPQYADSNTAANGEQKEQEDEEGVKRSRGKSKKRKGGVAAETVSGSSSKRTKAGDAKPTSVPASEVLPSVLKKKNNDPNKVLYGEVHNPYEQPLPQVKKEQPDDTTEQQQAREQEKTTTNDTPNKTTTAATTVTTTAPKSESKQNDKSSNEQEDKQREDEKSNKTKDKNEKKQQSNNAKPKPKPKQASDDDASGSESGSSGSDSETSSSEEEDPTMLNSDDDVSDGDSADEESTEGKSLLLAQYEKVNRIKTKWRLTLKGGVIQHKGIDYIFRNGQADMDFNMDK